MTECSILRYACVSERELVIWKTLPKSINALCGDEQPVYVGFSQTPHTLLLSLTSLLSIQTEIVWDRLDSSVASHPFAQLHERARSTRQLRSVVIYTKLLAEVELATAYSTTSSSSSSGTG